MRVEIWSDVACPWCYVGTARFERAAEQAAVDVEIVYRSFELDPRVPVGDESPLLTDYLAHKYGDPSRVRAAHARLTEAGAELGIDFRWRNMRRANTFDAHRLLAWSLRTAGAGPQRQLKKALLRAYFTDGRDVADRDVLAGLAGEVGLDATAARTLLESDVEADVVRAEREEAHANGITAVPTFVVHDQWVLQGALETDRWVKALIHMQGELESSPPIAEAMP